MSSWLMSRMFLMISMLLMMSICRVEANELWDFVRVGKGVESKPRWDVQNGKAQIELKGGRIEILAYYNGDDEGGLADIRRIAKIDIRGTIDASGVIKATHTLLHTDATPIQVTGRYTTRTERETWGAVRKIVTYKEIVFSYFPDRRFLGFLGRDVRDE